MSNPLPPTAPEREATRVTVEEAFDLGYAWANRLRNIHLGDSRDVARTLGSEIFAGLHIDDREVPGFASADAGIAACKRAIKAALTSSAEGEVERLRRERDKAQREMIAWRSAAQTMTPGGSEFMTPEAVREFVRHQRERHHLSMVKAVKARNAADAERDRLREALERSKARETVLTEAHSVASEANRSAWQVAEREGRETNWPTFRAALMRALETSHEALNTLTVNQGGPDAS